MLTRKAVALILAVLTTVFAVSCAGNSGTRETETETNAETSPPYEEEKDLFSDGDLRDVTDETPNATLTLSGDFGEISDTTRGTSGKNVTITSKGIYRVTGSSEDVTITVDDDKKSGVVYLVFENATMNNSSIPCVVVENADKVVILSDGVSRLTYTAEDSDQDGAIYSADDVTFGGRGTIEITSSLHGVVGKDDVRVTGGDVRIQSDGVGIKANDSLRIGDGTVDIQAGNDGIEVSDDVKDEFFVIVGGSLRIDALRDGINSEGRVEFRGGETAITSNDDAVHADGDLTVTGGSVTVDKSYEGLEAKSVTLSGGEIKVTASDDGINAAGGSVKISAGAVYVNSGGDGIDANGSLYVSGGTVIVEGPTDDGNGSLDIGKSGCVAEITGGTVLAIGSSGMAVNFDHGTQCSALVSLSGDAGDEITVNDGSGFRFTATKKYSCVLYSSPDMTEGNAYVITAGSASATADFSSGKYFSNVK